MKKSAPKKPETVEQALNRFSQMESTINFDITYNRSTKQYDYESVFIPAGRFTYREMVTLIIRERYSADEMEAIINNYLADQSDSTDFTAMQTWRSHAKEVAATFVDKE